MRDTTAAQLVADGTFDEETDGRRRRRRRRHKRHGCARRRPWREKKGRHHALIFFWSRRSTTGERMDILKRLETWPETPGEGTIPTLTRAVAHMLRNEDARRALVLVCEEKYLGHVVRPCLDTVVACVEAKLFSVSRRERRRLGRAPLRQAVKAEGDCKKSCPRGRPCATGRSFDAKTDVQSERCAEAGCSRPKKNKRSPP